MPTLTTAPDPTTRVDQLYTPHVGDVFVASWGYDQTNVDAVIVVRVSKSLKTVWTLPAEMIRTETHTTSERVRPTYKPAKPRTRSDGTPYYISLDHDGDDVSPQRHQVKQPTTTPLPANRAGPCSGPHIVLGNHRGYTTHAYLWTGEDYHQTAHGFGH